MIPADPDKLIDEIEKPIYTSLLVQRKRRPLFDLPVFWSLTLGFVSAALIAASVAGIIGTQRTTSLSSQADFYQSLIRTNNTLTNGATQLQLIMSKTNEALAEASSPTPSEEDLATTLDAIHSMINDYDTAITSYAANDLLSKHPDQTDLFSVVGQTSQVTQQQHLASNALYTWGVYHTIQEQVLAYLVAGNVVAAQYTQRFQAEPANSDALSTVNSLIQFNEGLVTTVEEAESVETQQILITTIVSAILAFLIIILVGFLVSRPLVVRLNQLLRVIHAVENGDTNARVRFVGRNEIGQVSTSMNTLLETIARLLLETRQQRDVLVNAVQSLSGDLKAARIDDLGTETTTSEDPIQMFASALNLNIWRLHHFAQRTQSIIEQLDAISYRELGHANSLLQVIAVQKQENGAKQFHMDLAISASESSNKNLQSQVITMQHISTQFAQEVIYLATQLVNLAQDLKQLGISLQPDLWEKSDRTEATPRDFSNPFDKPDKDASLPAFPSPLDRVQETLDVKKA